MKKLVWNDSGEPVLQEQITQTSGYPVWITSIVDHELRVRYSEGGKSVIVPPGAIGAYWADVATPEPSTAIAGDVRTMRSMELYQHFQAFRYAEVTVRGLGPAFQNAVAFIDEQVRIRVAEALKEMS